MKSAYLLSLGCALVILLLIFLPPLGVSNGWALVLAIAAILGCHQIHFFRHQPTEKKH